MGKINRRQKPRDAFRPIAGHAPAAEERRTAWRRHGWWLLAIWTLIWIAYSNSFQGTLVFELGAYVGETFIRNHGGRWGWAAMPGNRAFGLRTDSGLTAFPLTKAKKRLLGNFGSLVAFYRLLVRWPEIQEVAGGSAVSDHSTLKEA